MTNLGSEEVLNLEALKEHYDALGSYLHMPTLKQLSSGKGHNLTRLRNRWEKIATTIDAALASPIYNVTLGNFATTPCARCGKTIRKRIPHGKDKIEAKCFECGAGYEIHDTGPDSVEWKPIQQEIPCPAPDCEERVWIWLDEAEIGRGWNCRACGSRITVAKCVTWSEPEDGKTA